jgi:RNA polymerase-interacting CarD/CdnL/TRCF family regulator
VVKGIVNLAVGDPVVYGAHGAGTVTACETRSFNGEQQMMVVIALAGGMTVQLPLTLAQEQVRPLVDEAAIATIGQVLAGTPILSSESWLKRRLDAQAKLADAIGLAEIIRDGNGRETAPARRRSRLAPSERELVRRARALLTSEIALARDIPLLDAEAWVELHLSASR